VVVSAPPASDEHGDCPAIHRRSSRRMRCSALADERLDSRRIARAFAHQFAGDDFTSQFVHTKMELAVVPALWWPAQLPDMNRQAAAVDQDVHRRLACALVERDRAQLRLTPRDRGVIGNVMVQTQQRQERAQKAFGLSGGQVKHHA